MKSEKHLLHLNRWQVWLFFTNFKRTLRICKILMIKASISIKLCTMYGCISSESFIDVSDRLLNITVPHLRYLSTYNTPSNGWTAKDFGFYYISERKEQTNLWDIIAIRKTHSISHWVEKYPFTSVKSTHKCHIMWSFDAKNRCKLKFLLWHLRSAR